MGLPERVENLEVPTVSRGVPSQWVLDFKPVLRLVVTCQSSLYSAGLPNSKI